MRKSVEAMLQARSVASSDENISQLQDLIKENKAWHKGNAFRLELRGALRSQLPVKHQFGRQCRTSGASRSSQQKGATTALDKCAVAARLAVHVHSMFNAR